MSDADCGAGYVYNSANAALFCESVTCDAAGTAADKAACCVLGQLPLCDVPRYIAPS